MIRRVPGPHNFALEIIQRTMNNAKRGPAGEVLSQRGLADQLDCSESRVSHIKAGTQLMAPHEVPPFCRYYGTYALVAAIAEECDLDVIEKSPDRTVLPVTIFGLTSLLMKDIGALGGLLEPILRNGKVTPDEEVTIEAVDATLIAIDEAANALRARLSRLPRGVR